MNATDMKKQALIDAALQARQKAYAPYSQHPVGAALLGADGVIYSGCNVENAAYPLSQCAEATAIGTMVASGIREICHVVIAGPGDHLCSPCGGCRQKLNEFKGSGHLPVTIVGKDGGILLETTLNALLPQDFGPRNLQDGT